MYIGRNEVVLQMIAQASIGGNGQVYDPHPRNQTGGELNIKQWSSRPWNCVLRPRDPNMGLRLATLQRDACRNQNIGYDWARRTTYFSKLRAANWNPSAIRDKCDTDCSALTCANIAAVGHLMNNSQWASLGQLSTHYMRSALTSRGFLLLTDSRYLTSDKYLLPGDVLLNDGKHTAVNLDAGSLSGSSVIVSNGSSGPTFVPRLTEPSLTDKNWINTGYGGKNRCMVINKSTGSVLPNCTGYAWGRFMEILGSSPKLSTANAGMWYSYTSDGYERGSTPKLGAVLCMGKPGAAGHVAIVEKINSDGSIVTSESGYSSSKRFWTSTRRPPNYCNSPYYFQGFIYNPSASDMIGSDGMGMMGGLLYYVENDEDDAIMREVGYIQPDGKSTVNTTPYKLSVINYTTALGAFFKGAIGVPGMMGGIDGAGIDVNVSGVDNNVAKQIIQFCMSKGYNLAAACGVCGNVYAECGYNIAAVQKGASNPGLGICQWTYWSRKQAFLREVPDWKTNLTGQLNFMWKEVSTQYTGCHKKMLAVPNNEEGARQATIIWCDEYEAPGIPAKTKRMNEAVRLFKSSVIQM